MDHFKNEMQTHHKGIHSFDKLKDLQRKTDVFFKDKLFDLKENLNLTNQNSFLRKAEGLKYDAPDLKYSHQKQRIESILS